MMINDQVRPYPISNSSNELSALAIESGTLSRISWGAVFAGVVMALVVHLLLTMLGTGIGLSTVDPAQYESPSVQSLSFGAGLWWQVSSMLALFAGGWTAGRLASVPRLKDSMLHGILTWAVTTLVSAYLVSSLLGGVLAATGHVLGNVADGAGQVVSAVAPELADKAREELQQRGINLEALKREALTTLRQTGKPALQPEALENRTQETLNQAATNTQNTTQNSQAADQEFGTLFDRLFQEGRAAASQADRDALINVVMARTGVTRQEAATVVARWEQQYQQAKEEIKAQAREAADKAASAMSQTALWGFLALILGGLAAAYGARVGRPTTVAVAAS